jgi:single-strand DNA-binding protein
MIKKGKRFLVTVRKFMIHQQSMPYFGSNISSAHKIWEDNKINHQTGNLMDHINRIELKGRVGTSRTNIIGDNMVVNFSLVTEHLYKTRDGGAANETTWHQVTAWEGKDMPDVHRICKGMPVNVIGRVRTSKSTGIDGSERIFHEVLASKVRILNDEIIEL